MVCLSVICYVTESHAYDFVIKDFVIKKGALFVPDPGYNWLKPIAVKILYICTFHKTYNYVNSLLSPLPGSWKAPIPGRDPEA